MTRDLSRAEAEVASHLSKPLVEAEAAMLLGSMRADPGGNPGENRKSISHRCYPILVAFAWDLTKETINLPLGCLQGGATCRGGLRHPAGIDARGCACWL